MDDLLSDVHLEVEQVRAKGLALLQCAQRAANTGQINLYRSHDISIRSLLSSIDRNIREFDKRELLAVSGDQEGASTRREGVQGFYEDATASRTIAIKNVPRDVAHSLESEAAWRKNSYRNACKVERYLHDRLALTFPTLALASAKERKQARVTASRPQRLHKASLSSLSSLKTYRLEHSGAQHIDTSSFISTEPQQRTKPEQDDEEADEGMEKRMKSSTLRRLFCDWQNGLTTVVEFTPIGDGVTSVKNSRVRFSDQVAEESIELEGIKVSWIEVASKKQDVGSPAIARELTVAAQQKHFDLVKEHDEETALHGLLAWMDEEVKRLADAKVKADFASAFHLHVQDKK